MYLPLLIMYLPLTLSIADIDKAQKVIFIDDLEFRRM